MKARHPVLLFDGECGLCARCVRLLLALDRRRRLRFAPLQGVTAQAYLRARGLPLGEFESALFVPDWERREDCAPLSRTDALLGALAVAGGFMSPFAWLRVLPGKWRDAIYGWVARRRNRIFGRVRGLAERTGRESERFMP